MAEPGFCIAAIGELMWDLLPAGPALGGAPANFAAMMAKLAGVESETLLISAVGEDALGQDALAQIAAHGIGTRYIACNAAQQTGTVAVEFTAPGAPAYTISPLSAWDAICWRPELAGLAAALDAICFGTLAQRAETTRATLRRVIESTRPECLRLFDVNLRAPWWTAEALTWGFARANVVKMNEEEVRPVAQALATSCGEPLQLARRLLERFSLEMVAITRGSRGSLLVARGQVEDHPGIASRVIDTIGAGDAFTAGLAYATLRRWPLRQVSELANRLGAWAAARPGGMPRAEPEAGREWFQGMEDRR